MKDERFLYVTRAFQYFNLKKEILPILGDKKMIRSFFDGKKREFGKQCQIFAMWKSGVSEEECYIAVFLKKKCPKCGILKDRDCFHKNKASKDGLVNRCSSCKNEQNREFLSRPEVKKKRSDYSKTERAKDLDRNKHLRRTYGAMSSSGLRVINFQIITNDRTRYRISNYRRTRYCL